MNKLLIFFSIVLLLSFSGATTALAEEEQQGSIQLQSIAEVEREVFNEEGMKVLKRFLAGLVVPGTEVIYTNVYTNISDKIADNVVITNPVPEHMEYVEGSAGGDNTEINFSVDGGKGYEQPENLKLIDIDGKERRALANEYTNIRWTLRNPLQPGAKGEVSFRAKLQ